MKLFNDGQYFFLTKDTISARYYYILEGCCNVYLCHTKDGKPTGRRHFLFQLSAKDVAFPLPIVDGTSILVMPTTRVRVDDSEPLDEHALQTKRVGYIGVLASSLGCDRFQIGSLVESLTVEGFNEYVSQYTSKAIAMVDHDDSARLQNNRVSFERQKYTYYSSFSTLSSVLQGKKCRESILNGYSDSDDYLFKACRVVAKYLKIDIRVPLYLKNGSTVENPLEEIALASKFRTRKVTLDGKWYTNPTLPYVAHLKDGNVPVALIPTAFGYRLYNPSSDSYTKVDRSIESLIDLQECYIVYRNLPAESVTTKALLKYVLNGIRKVDLVCMLLVGALGGLLSIIFPLAVSWIFDTVIPNAEQTLLKRLAILLVSITCVQYVFELIRSYTVMRMQVFTDIDIQSAVWDRLLSLPTGFFSRYSSGELAKRLDGLSEISQIVSDSVVNQLLTFTFGLFYVFVMFYISPNLAGISLVAVLIVALVSIALGYGEVRYYNQISKLSAELSGSMVDWLNSITKIRTTGSESRVFNIWAKDFTRLNTLDVKRSKVHNVSSIFISAVYVVVLMCLYFYIVRVDGSQLDSGMFVAFNTALTVLLANFITLTQTITELNRVVSLYKNVKPILEETSEYDTSKENIGSITGNIEVSHISFRYSNDTPLVLDDVSLHIKSGEHIALVGASGSGKSTLLRVLLGFENVESGQVYYDGKDISQYDIRSLRKQLGVVLQSGTLINGSIFENVVGSSTSLTINDVENALERTGILDEIRAMPMGLRTIVSEDFGTISGGQKQRILIARALVSNPRVLFFDEATSALDNYTQKVVSNSINGLEITRVTIAHRLSTITECDRIIVLDGGKIVEEGSYEELLNKQGLFFNMAKRQMVD